MRVAKEMDRVLVIVSSMGQKANQTLTPEHRKDNSIDYRLEDVKKFISRVTKDSYVFRVDAAMVPQYSLAFRNVAEASSAVAEMREVKPTLKNIILGLDQNRETVTISATLTPPATEFFIAGQSYSHKDLGFLQLEIDDHHSGCHCPEGTLLIYNSRTSKASPPSVNYLEYAPAMLKHFGLPHPSYMVEPTFTI